LFCEQLEAEILVTIQPSFCTSASHDKEGRRCAVQAEMAEVLERLEARSAELGVSDIQLSLSSLEEVFLTIARKVCRPGRCMDCLGTTSLLPIYESMTTFSVPC